MTKDDAMEALLHECPNGVSFDPMAVRLLQQKVPFEDWQIEDLKTAMFQLGNGLWFSREMISDDDSREAFEDRTMEWISEHGCFSVERIFKEFCDMLRHIFTPEDCAAFLQHLGFMVANWGKGGDFCYLPPPNLDDSLATISETIAGWLENEGGILALNTIEETMPYLSAEALEGIRAQFLPEFHEIKVGEVPCWRSAEAIPLPDDFAEKLTTIVDTLVSLNEKVSAKKLEFALNLFYRIRFRDEYVLPDNGTFMRVCAKHYRGGNDVFSKKKKPCVRANVVSSFGRRVRSPNTRFRNLGVPIGAELVFTKDRGITCIVLDDSNKVQYEGRTWAISALAVHFLDVSVANGFSYFRYGGETLWERRLRLEREGAQEDNPGESIPPPDAVREADSNIIGLEGRALSPATWRAFRSAGANPRVAEWTQRLENGESLESIADKSGLMVSTVKEYIKNRRRYFLVCTNNGIMPEGGADV